MAAVLDGIRVLDMTIFQQGPYSAAMLADLGADVIKIEGPDSPDPGRGFGQPPPASGLRAYWETLNRGKRAIALDLKTEAGREVLHHLVAGADVFVSNLRYKALERLGADYDTLSKIKPDLIYAHATGYGPEGPDADLGSMDILGQARGGLMAVTGEPDAPPMNAGAPIADHVGAICLGFGIMTALLHRERTGEGQRLEGSLLAGQLCIQSHNITGTALEDGRVPKRTRRNGTNPTWNSFRGSDGKWFVLGMSRDVFWTPTCRLLGHPEWIADERYATLSARVENVSELLEQLDAIFATKAADEWVRLFSDANLMAARVNDYAEVASDPQVIANRYVTEVERADGSPPVKMVNHPIIYYKTPARIRGLAPEFGQHTEEVLLEAGYTWETIESLREAGAIGARRGELAAGR
jgi:crotonobetainyl-CoA:carnitine CoA-transferase CaiB-like acyl-CoA transferase